MDSIQRVRPGDLITAGDWNLLIDRVSTLSEKVETLEQDRGDSEVVVIDELRPRGTGGDPIRVRGELHIIGRNFGFSVGGHRVRFDDVSITAFRAGSSDRELVVEVPATLTNIPESGRPVTLTVSNGTTNASRVITVLPMLQTLTGDVDVEFREMTDPPNPNPNPIPKLTGTDTRAVTFAYRLRSRASVPADFTVRANVSVEAWQASVKVLDANGAEIPDRRVRLAPHQTADIAIRVTVAQTALNSFDLTVVADAGTVVRANTRTFAVGAATAGGDPEIVLNLTDTTVFNVASGDVASGGGSFDDVRNVASVRQGHVMFLTFAATFKVAAIYTVSVQTDAGTTGWTVQLANPTPQGGTSSGSYDERNATVPRPEAPSFSVQPQSGATPMGKVTLRIQRTGETRVQERSYELVRLT